MRDRLIQAIIADRTRVQTLLVSACIALCGSIATKLLGFELTAEHNAMITLMVTLAIGWAIEAYAGEKNAQGGERIQAVLQQVKPDLEVDRFIGDKTVAAAEDLVMAQSSKEPTTPPTRSQ
jgi:hypothetical protein